MLADPLSRRSSLQPASELRLPVAGSRGATNSEGNVLRSSPRKHTQVIDTADGLREFVLEHAVIADFALSGPGRAIGTETSGFAIRRATSTRSQRCVATSPSRRSRS